MTESQGVKALGQFLPENVPLCDVPGAAPLFHILLDGTWQYLASPLPLKFAKLFASILYCIEGEHFLITPVEKLRVSVAKSAFVIVDYQLLTLEVDNVSGLKLITSLGSEHIVDSQDTLNITDEGIYTQLMRGVTACFGRACYYRYVNEFIA